MFSYTQDKGFKNPPLVLIFDRSGTSFVVKVALSSVFTMALKQSRVWTLTESIRVLVKRSCTSILVKPIAKGETYRDLNKQNILYGPVVQNLAQVRYRLEHLLLNRQVLTLERVVYERHDIFLLADALDERL